MKKQPPLAVAVGIVAGLVSVAGVFGLTFSERGEATRVVAAPVASLAQDAPHEPAPIEPVEPAPIAESEHAITNRTVEDLLAGVLDARKRGDNAWLARTLHSTAGREQLTHEDLGAAFRQFLWVSASRLWQRVETAWAERKYSVAYNGEAARATFEVGGALGELWFDFVRVGDGWYFAGI